FHGLMSHSAGNSDKLLVIGDTLKANGDLELAKEAYQDALSASPGSLKAQRGIQRIEAAEADSQKSLRLAKSLNNIFQQRSSLDFYEETLSKNPRQPDARLALSKLYEKQREYDKAATSYQFYLGLKPDLDPKEREHYEKKINHLRELAQKQTMAAKHS